jgi:GT2 family glycosyltransferase
MTTISPDSGGAVSQRVLDVAVVIVTYKSAGPTIEALKSLATERTTPYLSIRAIVVDNASGDSPEITQAIEDHEWSAWVTLVLAPKNGGFAYGNNLGIGRAYASGTPSYLYLLNPDTLVRPGAVGSLVRFLESHPAVGIAGSSFETHEGKDWPIAFRFPGLISEIVRGLEFGIVTKLLEPWATIRRMGKSSEPVDWVSGAAVMIRPALLAAVGGLDENYFLFFEETDFCRRARAAGFQTWYVPDSRVMHVGGHSTMLSERAVRRLPDYWFESRRRYFVVTYGLMRAIMIDIVAVLAHSLGSLKRIAQRRRDAAVPHFIRDFIHHSVIWRRNRSIPAPQCRIVAPTDPVD